MQAKVVLITGASSGIGRATALACAARGMRVALAGRRADVLEVIAYEVTERGGTPLVCPGDLRSTEHVQSMTEAVLATFGRIDVLITSAGRGSVTPLHELTDDEIDDVIGTNLSATVRCARAVAPAMIAAGQGHIITLSSVVTGLMFPRDALYAATKAGVLRFTMGIAAELRPYGIRVSAVLPGIVDTPLNVGLTQLPKADVRVVAADIVGLIDRPRVLLVTPGWYRVALALNRAVPGIVDAYIARRLAESSQPA